MNEIVLNVWPNPGIAGSGVFGTGGAVLVIMIVLVWIAVVRPRFVF
jgi:hypothetical protein